MSNNYEDYKHLYSIYFGHLIVSKKASLDEVKVILDNYLYWEDNKIKNLVNEL